MTLVLRMLAPDGVEVVNRFHGDEVVLGRSSECDLVVPDQSVSRQHARLFRNESGWWVQDLGSRNGTVVDTVRITTPAPLEEGSTIRMGSSLIVVESGSDVRTPAEKESDSHTRYVPAVTLLEGLQLRRRKTDGPGAATQLEEVASRLELLNEVHQALAEPWALSDLLAMILDRVFEHLQPEQAAIFLREADDAYTCAASRSKTEGGAAVLYSKSLLSEVAGKGMSALVLDAQMDSRFAEAQSLVTSGVRSLAAAPLLDPEGSLGMIVVGSRIHVRQFDENELELLTSLASVAAMRIRNLHLAEEAAERRRLEREVALARRIQEVLLPSAFPDVPGWELWGTTIPSRGASGDMFKVVELEDGRIVFLIADVSGKGIGAALLTASLEALTAVPIQDGYPPSLVLGRAGRLLCERTPLEKFATAFLGVLEPESGMLTWSNAGHPPALVLQPDGGVRRLDATGVPVGLFLGAEYEEHGEQLAPGETLVLYTDGFTEVETANGELGVEGLVELCRHHVGSPSEELAAAVAQEIEELGGENAFSDDRTLVVARRID